MTITAQMVKELRDKTGAGMMDAKKALVEAEIARLKKIRNQYEYHEGYKGASHKREDRIRAFKLTIPTEAGTAYEYCFRIPEKFGNARTRNQAMGNRLEELSCSEFNAISK